MFNERAENGEIGKSEEAKVMGNREHCKICEINADLLAVCEELLLVAGTYKPIDMYDWERVSAVIDQAKAALKKARCEE